MKKIIVTTIFAMAGLTAFPQDLSKFNLYSPGENAGQKIDAAVVRARQEHKYVFVQIGGNWCIWCARFHDFITTDRSLDSIMRTNYIVYHLNYSKENYNAKLLARYGYPQRFGFPVFLILDGDGKLLHTQNSAYLEDGKKSYNKDVVMEFLTQWCPAALDPKQYKEQ